MNYQELSILTQWLNPIEIQPQIRVCRDVMNRINAPEANRLNDLFFHGRDSVYQSRKDSFKTRGLESFTLSVLFWGFPRNNHQVCTKAYENWFQLREVVGYMRSHREMTAENYNNLIASMDDIVGLGISTYSKLLYFSQVSINGIPSAILDSFVVKGIQNLTGQEFNNLRGSVTNWRRYVNYPGFLRFFNELASQLGVPAHNLEYTLWLAGKNNR